MIEVNNTCDSSATEVQVCQGLEFSDVGDHSDIGAGCKKELSCLGVINHKLLDSGIIHMGEIPLRPMLWLH